MKEKVKEAAEQALGEGTSEGVRKAWLKRKRRMQVSPKGDRFRTQALEAHSLAMNRVREQHTRLSKAFKAAMQEHEKKNNEGTSNWAHTGDLEHYRSKMKEIADSMLGEGEYAKARYR